MSPFLVLNEESETGFPRVSGDEPAMRQDVDGVMTFSPRERG